MYYEIAMTRKALENAVIEFTHAIGLFVRRVRAASATHGLSMSQAFVLGRLDKEGPATTADLARAEGVKPQSMGTTVASLEELGLVQRKPHPTDGRQVYIALTAKGAEMRKSIGDAKQTWLTQAISQLDERERETLFAAGKIIERLAKL
jgi:DNA-binding MarR family transcriptional regulator